MQAWTTWFQVAGLEWDEPKTGPKFSEYPLLLEAAANGAGVALVGEILSTAYLRAGRLLRLFDVAAVQKRKYFIVCQKSKLDRPDIAAFIDWLLSEAEAHVFKGAEESLRAGNALNTVFDNLPAGAIYVNGDAITFNKAVETITGYGRDEVRTLGEWFEKIYGRRSAAMRKWYESEKRSGRAVNRTGPIVRKDGTVRTVEFSCLGNSDGEVWLVHDITDRVEIEE